MNKNESLYIGDGVYVEWDGFHIILKTGDSTTYPRNTIYLEDTVMEELIRYFTHVMWFNK